MAGVLALLLVVSGSLFAMAALAIAWTALFACVHVIGELARPIRDRAKARARRSEACRVDAVEVPLILPGPVTVAV
jgi:hypothetical protein